MLLRWCWHILNVLRDGLTEVSDASSLRFLEHFKQDWQGATHTENLSDLVTRRILEMTHEELDRLEDFFYVFTVVHGCVLKQGCPTSAPLQVELLLHFRDVPDDALQVLLRLLNCADCGVPDRASLSHGLSDLAQVLHFAIITVKGDSSL